MVGFSATLQVHEDSCVSTFRTLHKSIIAQPDPPFIPFHVRSCDKGHCFIYDEMKSTQAQSIVLPRARGAS